jgi:hypothetical protein
MPSLIDKINQENKDIAEIEKVARYDGKGMFWQWVGAGKWFLGGAILVVVLNLIMVQFIPEKGAKISDEKIQNLVFECQEKRKPQDLTERPKEAQTVSEKINQNVEKICEEEVIQKIEKGEEIAKNEKKNEQPNGKQWFDYSLNSTLQTFLNIPIPLTIPTPAI